MARLKDKIALITGANKGIGKAIADLFVSEGAVVISSDTSEPPECFDELTTDRQIDYRLLDVADPTAWESMEKYISKKYGHLDVLVNNAGITGFIETSGPHDPENLDLESWRKVHSINSDGVALGCKVAIKLMKESTAASIVNLSSRSGIVGIPSAAAYASSKASVRNHTKTVALYCAEKGYPIRCNSIHPGAILTPMWEVMLGTGDTSNEAMKAITSDIPLRKMGEAIDVAFAALYLASDESKYVTGIELNVDGGMLAGIAVSPK